MLTADKILIKMFRFAEILGAVAIVTMMLHISADVFLKYLFNKPIPGTLELVATYYMVAILFLPLGAVTRLEGHISVELFSQFLSKASQNLMIGAAFLLSSLYTGVLAWRGFLVAIHTTKIFEVWEAGVIDIQVWPTRWLVPLGCGLATAAFVLVGIDKILEGWKGQKVLPPSGLV